MLDKSASFVKGNGLRLLQDGHRIFVVSYWRRECAVRPEREVSASAWRIRQVREVLAEDGENIAVRRKAKIRQYSIAVIRRFCYNPRYESNHADS